MCPDSEISSHTRENSPFEFNPSTKSFDSNFAIKHFHRSSAGNIEKESDIRPLPILISTVNYIITQLIPLYNLDLSFYHFLSDRFRAIEKDIFVQKIVCIEVIPIYEIISSFHIISGILLNTYPTFDPFLTKESISRSLFSLIQTFKDLETDETFHKSILESPFYYDFWAAYLGTFISQPIFLQELHRIPSFILQNPKIRFLLKLRSFILNDNIIGFLQTLSLLPFFVQCSIILFTPDVWNTIILKFRQSIFKREFHSSFLELLQLPKDSWNIYGIIYNEEKQTCTFDLNKQIDHFPDLLIPQQIIDEYNSSPFKDSLSSFLHQFILSK